MNKLIGKLLDERYLIQAVVGNGGMAVVYKAMDTRANRVVAVKVLREECMQNEELVRRFKNESKAISVLDHPNIVQVYDVSVTQTLQYIAMEYVDGITLKDYMKFKNNALSYKEVMHFTTQTLKALQHAHSKGIVHRDIKPQNIMMLSNGVIKVMDFGIARFARSENQTMTDKAIGSVHYISPEQAKGEVTDHRADIYSVGVMLYEMLAGKLPFDSDTPVSVALMQISDVATPLSQIKPTIPPGLEDITEHAMAKEPRERYQSALAMLTDINEFIKNPQIEFDYKYVADTSPTVLVDRAKPINNDKKPNAGQMLSGVFSGGAMSRTKTKKSKGRNFKNKWIWPAMAGGTLAFLIISLIACYMILQDTVLFVEAADAELPNFVGQMRSEVEGNNAYSEFSNITFEEVPDTENPAGMIVGQNPKPPKVIKTTTQITLRVSSGVVQAPVPDVLGAEEAGAIQAIKDAGFSAMLRYRQVENETDPYGYVVELTLADGTPIGAGQLVDTGTVVQIHVSSAYRDNTVKVQNYVGLVSIEEAQTALFASRLGIGAVTLEDSLLPAGSIIRQNPEYVEDPNQGYVAQGTLVDLVVSAGHTHTWFDLSRVEATCQIVGHGTRQCSVCGAQEDYEIPMLEHIWVVEGAVVTNPDGSQIQRYVCTVTPNQPHWKDEVITPAPTPAPSSSATTPPASSSATPTPPVSSSAPAA